MTPETLVSVFCPSTTRSERTRTRFTSPPCGEVGRAAAGWGLFTSPPCGEVGPDREAVPAGRGLTTAEGPLISSIFRGLPELVEALAERDDRIHVGLGVDAEVDQEWALRPLRRIERGRDVLELLDAQRGQPVSLAELHEVRHVREVDLRADAAIEVVLELADHAERAVVEQHDLDVELVLDRDRQLLRGHDEAALAGHAPHRQVRPAELRAQRRRQREAHGARAARVDEKARSV